MPWEPTPPDLTCCRRGDVLENLITRLSQVAEQITSVRAHVHDTGHGTTGDAGRFLRAETTALDKSLAAFDAVTRPLRSARQHSSHLCDLREQAGATHT